MARRKETAILISLRSWQSLKLTVMLNRALISTQSSQNLPEYNEEIEFNRYRRPPKKTSIKKQIKSIIKSYGWAPAQLDWKDIKSSMTRNQIDKYGASTQKFIKKYNDKITEMNLPSSKQMPRNYSFNDMLSLSRFINATPSRNVRKLLMSMDDDTLKQMMLNTLSLFLIPKNREKYLNQNHERSRQNHRIVEVASDSMKRRIKNRKLKYGENVFDRLPEILSSHVCSFLDPKSLSNVSFTCHSLCKASTESAGRSNTRMSAQKLARMRQLPTRTMKNCRFVESLSLNNLQRGYEQRFTRIFMELIPNCRNLKSLEMDSISDKLGVQVLNVVAQCIEARNCDICSLTISAAGGQSTADIPWSLLKNLKTLTVKAEARLFISCLQQLWVKGPAGFHVPNPNYPTYSNIAPYIHSPSDVNLKHLTLCDLTSIAMVCHYEAHPLFWLWNIPNLESAELGVKLSARQEWQTFGDQCQTMLEKQEMQRASKAQTSFKSLVLKFNNLKGVFDWNSIFTNIRLMYPNLKEIAYNILPVKRGPWEVIVETDVKVSGSIEWKVSFGGLKRIELGIGVAIEAANSLLTTINENDQVFRNLEVCNL